MLHDNLPIEHRIIYTATRCLRTIQEVPFSIKEFLDRASLYNITMKKSNRRIRYLRACYKKATNPTTFNGIKAARYTVMLETLHAATKSAEQIYADALKQVYKTIEPEYNLTLAS